MSGRRLMKASREIARNAGGTSDSTATSVGSPAKPSSRPRISALRPTSAPDRSSRAMELGYTEPDLRQHETQRPGQAALDLEDAVPRFDELAVAVEDRQPGPDGRLGRSEEHTSELQS